jgi:hypothetical protein
MKKVALFLVFIALALFLTLSSPAHADGETVEVNSRQLIERSEEFDGREVVLVGEVVGDVMVRGDHAWLTVNDDQYSKEALREAGSLRGGNSGIGVWLPASEAEKVKTVGRYRTTGDYVLVEGTFNADCREHGGDMDIHARTLEVILPGRKLEISLEPWKYLVAGLAFLFLLGSTVPFFRRRAREMRSARSLLEEEQ